MGLLEEDLPCCITLTRQKWLDKLRDMLDKWTEYLESGGQIDVVYTDFEKAFDKVPHKRLLSKLHSYEINDSIINWIKDFLAARKYRVKVNGSYSSWAEVTSGTVGSHKAMY